MSTPAQIAAQAGRRRRRLYLTLAAGLLVLVVAGAWFLGRASTAPEPQPTEPTPPPAADSDEFELLTGRSMALGRYQVGFPQTPQGAASAAVHELHSQSTTDAQALSEAMSTYHLHDYSVEAVETIILQERAMDLFLSQPEGTDFEMEDYPLPGAYMNISPLAVWWEQKDAETVEVLVLADNKMSDGAALILEGRSIYGRAMTWDAGTRDGDWVVEEITDPDKTNTRVSPEDLHLDNPEWTPITITGAGEGT